MKIRTSEPISVIPVDLGASIEESLAVVESTLAKFGWMPASQQQQLMTSIVGDRASVFERGDTRLIVTASGLAAFILPWEPVAFTRTEPLDARVHLTARRNQHAAFRDGTSSILQAAVEVIPALRVELRRMQPVRNRRYLDPKIYHYAMTTFFWSTTGRHRPANPAFRKSLSLCLDPSSSGLADTEHLTASQGGRVHDNALPGGVTVVQLEEDCILYASWSSVIVAGRPSAMAREMTLAFQVRTQLSWLAAWLAQRIADTSSIRRDGRVSPRRLAWQRTELDHMRRWSRARTTSSESVSMRSLREAFADTSDLDAEWTRAEEAMEAASERARLVLADLDFRRTAVLETMLLVISVASLAPLFLVLPLQTADGLSNAWPALVTLGSVGVLGAFLIWFRRR